MELDETLARLAAVPVPDLSALDGHALADEALAQQRTGRTALGVALTGAFAIGVVGGLQSPVPAPAQVAAFGLPPALTPLIGLARG